MWANRQPRIDPAGAGRRARRRLHNEYRAGILFSLLAAIVASPRSARREIFFASDRDGLPGTLDIWTATRERTSDPWGPPVKLGAHVNSPAIEAVPTLSWDGATLIFVSFRAGNPDLYQSTRTRITGKPAHSPRSAQKR